jgi:hypothetical protein
VAVVEVGRVGTPHRTSEWICVGRSQGWWIGVGDAADGAWLEETAVHGLLDAADVMRPEEAVAHGLLDAVDAVRP